MFKRTQSQHQLNFILTTMALFCFCNFFIVHLWSHFVVRCGEEWHWYVRPLIDSLWCELLKYWFPDESKFLFTFSKMWCSGWRLLSDKSWLWNNLSSNIELCSSGVVGFSSLGHFQPAIYCRNVLRVHNSPKNIPEMYVTWGYVWYKVSWSTVEGSFLSRDTKVLSWPAPHAGQIITSCQQGGHIDIIVTLKQVFFRTSYLTAPKLPWRWSTDWRLKSWRVWLNLLNKNSQMMYVFWGWTRDSTGLGFWWRCTSSALCHIHLGIKALH